MVKFYQFFTLGGKVLSFHIFLWFYFSGDETFNDVFRDFTNMASNNPEKLKRK